MSGVLQKPPVVVEDDIQNEVNKCINLIATRAAALDDQEWDQVDLSGLTRFSLKVPLWHMPLSIT